MRALVAPALWLLVALTVASCTNDPGVSHPDASSLTNDSGLDANDGLDGGLPPPVRDTCVMRGGTVGQRCVNVADCQDGCFCNGTETCTNSACALSASPCTDTIACTTDACLEEADRCVHVPDHAMCSDHLACNGYERCNPLRSGCVSATPLVCNDESACTVDSCDDAQGCVFIARDLDHDGFVAGTCGGLDCDDYDPEVRPGAIEICDNLRDDNCDGLRDYADPTCIATNDTCAQAIALALPITSRPSDTLVGFADDLRGGACAESGLVDAFYSFTLSSAMNVSLDAITVPSSTNDVWLTLRGICGDGADLACETNHGSAHIGTSSALAAGTYYVFVEMRESEASDFRLQFSAFP